MWFVLIVAAWAGYGDAYKGHPNRAEREAHLWTNGVRIAPAAYQDDYGAGSSGTCWGDFGADETKPRPPLAWHDGLADIARQHSADMADHNKLSHTSSDGTGFGARVGPYYPAPNLGENVASGFTSPFEVVMGWMCSSGHRSNILEPGFVELGIGVSGLYWTQDFGGRRYDTRVLNMGVHLEDAPAGSVTLAVDAWEPVAPVVAVLDGVAEEMEVARGGPSGGVYEIELETDTGCHLYWFASGGERFPEEGAYGFGDCTFDDETAGWMSAASVDALLPYADLDGDGEPDHAGGPGGKKGCAQGGGAASWAGLLVLLAMRRRRAVRG